VNEHCNNVKSTRQGEIQQSMPFRSLEEEAYLALLRTTDVLARELGAFLKPYHLSEPQYNVLRILRGAGADGRTCSEVGQRLVTKDPDVTRLLDRLEQRDLLSRTRDQRDRRIVTIRITAAGVTLLDEIDQPIAALVTSRLRHLGDRGLRQLIALLEAAARRVT